MEKIVTSQNAKGVVALTRKGGLKMEAAVRVQLHLARIPPHMALFAGPDRGYPMNDEEMRWQIEFFESMAPVTST